VDGAVIRVVGVHGPGYRPARCAINRNLRR
jgi:hypothetical protein